MAKQWVPLMGAFDIRPNEIVFEGGVIPPSDGESKPIVQVGILATNQVMVNGRLAAKVSFADVSPSSVCELMLGYDVTTQSQITAGLGGSGAFFSIREWVNKSAPRDGQGTQQGGWSNLALGGDRVNLQPGVEYDLSAQIDGSSIMLDVNGVRVAEGRLRSAPNKPQQVGIFCLNETTVTIRDFTATAERPKAFIVMQFSSPYNDVYSHVIKAACDEFGVDAIRADEIYGSSSIIVKDVIDRITTSQLVIADISPANPNVYFEVGYALALNKPIILLAQHRPSDSPLPFDISAFRVLFYDDSIGGKPKLEAGLRSHLRQILGRQ